MSRWATALGKFSKVFRIGHLGDFNAPMLLGTLGAIEMGLELAGVPFKPEGVRAAMDELVKSENVYFLGNNLV